jgi:hypothetical protein
MRKPRTHLSNECLAEMERLFRLTGKRRYSDQQIADYLFARGFTQRPISSTTVHHRRVAICGYRQRWRAKGPLARKMVRSYGWMPGAGRYILVSMRSEKSEGQCAPVCVPAPTPAPAPAPAPAAAAPMNEENRLARLERVLAQMVELQLRAIQKTR